MKNYIYIIALLLNFYSLKAQDTPFDKKLFKDQKDVFKVAKQNLKDGNAFFELVNPNYINYNLPEYKERTHLYRKALPLLYKAHKFNPNNADLNYKIGRCYIENTVFKSEAIIHLKKALELNSEIASDIQYHLGIAYHIDMQFDNAIKAFKKYQSTLSTKNEEELANTLKKINECIVAKQLVAEPERVFIDNFGKPVNTKYPEYGAIISADESVMMFTSRRNTSFGAQDLAPGATDYAEDIYISYKKDGEWSAPENMGSPINTEGHDATTALSADAQRMIVYKDGDGDGNLYECTLTGDTWSKPKKLGKNINSKYHESSASYSSDGKKLYYVSNKDDKESVGNHDIYVSEWDTEKERWGESKNLGDVINTEYNEEAVVIHPDGKTLYFSSQGHRNMGGYDVFKSSLNEDGTWSKPQNMGYPINTIADDVFFVINGSGRRGYYSSYDKDGEGETDILMITFLGPTKPVQLNGEDNLLASIAKPVSENLMEKQVVGSTKKITILKGITRDNKTKKPLEATLELIDIELNKTLATFKSNSKIGNYLVSLPSGKNYGLIVKVKGYLFHSENFNIPSTAAYQELVKNIDLKKIEIGSTIVLKNIFYDYNKSSLRDASKNELDRLVKLLIENPSLKIELSAHTDSRGGNKYNQNLSQKRAQTCVDYLVTKGIGTSRLIPKGYGETDLINSDTKIAKLKFEEDKENAHQENRRTEFKILAK